MSLSLLYFLPQSSSLWLRLADKKLARTLTKMNILTWDLKASGRLESTFPLAYTDESKRMQFASTQEWATGLYKTKDQYITVFMRKLEFDSPHLYFDYKSNNSLLKKDFPVRMNESQLLRYEGVMEHKFNFFAPTGYRIDALVIGAPDFLMAIDDYHDGADIEIMGNQLYFIYPQKVVLADKLEGLIKKSEYIAERANDNLSRYNDTHSGSKDGILSPAGRRIVRK